MTRDDSAVLATPAEQTMTVDPAVHRRRWAILAVLALSLIIISLDDTVLNVAQPSLQRPPLQATANDVQWIIDAYTLVFASLVLVGGNLGDRYGRKACLQIGLVLLAGGSTLVVLSDTPAAVIVSRAVMAVGGALIMPATLSITSTIFVGAERAKAIAVWAACAAVGVSLGPVAGGWLLEHYWWGSVFLMNIPIAVTALVAGTLIVPASKGRSVGPPDLAGAALSTAGISALVYAIIAAPDDGWFSATVAVWFGASVLILGAFVAVELRIAHPMLPLGLFRSARFAVGCLAIVITFFALLGAMYFLTQYLQIVRGYSTFEAGLRTLPLAFGVAVAAPRSAGLAVRFGANRLVAGGMLVTACGLAVFAFVKADTDYLIVVVALALVGLGMGVTMAPATESVMGAVPEAQAGVGSAVNDAARQLGCTFGVAILGSVLATRYSDEVTSQLRVFGPISAATRAHLLDSVGRAHTAAIGLPRGAVIRETANSAFVSAMGVTALVAAGVAVAGAGYVAIFLPARQVSETAQSVEGVGNQARHVPRHRSPGDGRLPSPRLVTVADLSPRVRPHAKDNLVSAALARESTHHASDHTMIGEIAS